MPCFMLILSLPYSLYCIYVNSLSSLGYKTSRITGGVGGPGLSLLLLNWVRFCNSPWLLVCPFITISKKWSFKRNSQISKPLLHFKNRGSGGFTCLLKIHLFENCYKSAYLEPRAITKTPQI